MSNIDWNLAPTQFASPWSIATGAVQGLNEGNQQALQNAYVSRQAQMEAAQQALDMATWGSPAQYAAAKQQMANSVQAPVSPFQGLARMVTGQGYAPPVPSVTTPQGQVDPMQTMAQRSAILGYQGEVAKNLGALAPLIKDRTIGPGLLESVGLSPSGARAISPNQIYPIARGGGSLVQPGPGGFNYTSTDQAAQAQVQKARIDLQKGLGVASINAKARENIIGTDSEGNAIYGQGNLGAGSGLTQNQYFERREKLLTSPLAYTDPDKMQASIDYLDQVATQQPWWKGKGSAPGAGGTGTGSPPQTTPAAPASAPSPQAGGKVDWSQKYGITVK